MRKCIQENLNLCRVKEKENTQSKRKFLENLFRILECQKSIKLRRKFVEVSFVRKLLLRDYIFRIGIFVDDFTGKSTIPTLTI